MRGVAVHGVAEQALVGVHPLIATFLWLLDDRQFHRVARHAFARALRPGADADRDLGRQPEADVVAVARLTFLEHHGRRLLQIRDNLGGVVECRFLPART